MELNLTAWVVNYPWSEAEGDAGHFNSSNTMLNKVWELCKNTVKVTSLDTTTDSNTREKLPYEADGFITGTRTCGPRCKLGIFAPSNAS